MQKIDFESQILALFDTSPFTQNSIISFEYVDSLAKIFLILHPPFENSRTRIAILNGLKNSFVTCREIIPSRAIPHQLIKGICTM